MPDLTAKRTLVKSPPELWEELSEVERLAKHLGAFGEIKITKLEPEHTVAWEGEHASGTVSIEPSGWGTKVTLHAELPQSAEPEPEPEPEAEPEPPAADAAEEGASRGFWGWLFRPRTGSPPEPEPVAEPEPLPDEPVTEPPAAEEAAEDAPVDSERARVILDDALDALGAAHHRPFSRG
jgi:hypothetical protein